ncbi:MAG: response regulator [Ruminococcus sp.]|jgi:CheY-like chemotaxis protein|nr:response regulator [Ruminococcus sp.]
MSEHRILITDDSEINLEIASTLITEKFGIPCDTAISGFIAVNMCEAVRYDIIFMDYLMPKMTGVETAEKIRLGSLNKDTPIVALTGADDPETRAEAEKGGFAAFLTKPMDDTDITNTIKRFIPEAKERENASTVDEFLTDSFGVPGLEPAKGLRNVGGNKEALKKALYILLKKIPSFLFDLHKSALTDDFESMRLVYHTLKTSLANVGFTALSESAAQLEKSIIGGSTVRAKENGGRFIDSLESIKSSLERLFADFPDEVTPIVTGDAADYEVLIMRLKSMIDDFDYQGIKSILERNKSIDFGEEKQKVLAAVGEKIDLFDYDGAAEVLS